MPPNSDSRFAPPIRISQIMDGQRYDGQPALPGPDIAVVVASWGPSHHDERHDYYVRNVVVSKLGISKTEKGKTFRLCMFPGGFMQWVNDDNITQRKRRK